LKKEEVNMVPNRKFGLFLGYGVDFTYPAYRVIAREAERLQYDALWVQDNITGHHPIPRDIEILDTWTFLTALAVDTTTIRIGSMATPALRRFAPLLAKTIASLDVISNGRVNVGLGSGDDTYQYEMIGQRFPETGEERRKILLETIQVMKLIWTEDVANFSGEHFHLKDAIFSPKPVQKPNPPIYIACNTSRRLMPRMAAQYGDGMGIMWGHDPSVAVTVKAFQEEWQSFNRDPNDFAALRSAFIIFTNIKDDERARRYESKITTFPYGQRQTASPAKVPEGSDPDLYLIGSPAHIAEELEKRSFQLGFNQIMTTFVVCEDMKPETDGFPGWAGSYLAGLRLFAEQVIPLLKH
jgi:alkanesulfonate monooxygenase SsuD/methylene tetrahydromethanopterin reductase-like flavin-dependent oxidoreductase (luciferase family)